MARLVWWDGVPSDAKLSWKSMITERFDHPITTIVLGDLRGVLPSVKFNLPPIGIVSVQYGVNQKKDKWIQIPGTILATCSYGNRNGGFMLTTAKAGK